MFLQIYKEVFHTTVVLSLQKIQKKIRMQHLDTTFHPLISDHLTELGKFSCHCSQKKLCQASYMTGQKSEAQKPTHSLHCPREGYVQRTATTKPTKKLINKNSLFPLLSHLFFISQSIIPSSGFAAKCSKRSRNWFRHGKDTVKLGFL